VSANIVLPLSKASYFDVETPEARAAIPGRGKDVGENVTDVSMFCPFTKL